MSIFNDLDQRGLIHQHTDRQRLKEALEGEPLTLYAGFDPSADSLHVGSLTLLMTLARLERAGHQVIALVGGGTAFVGDPSGRGSERELMDEATIRQNAAKLKQQIGKFVTMGEQKGQGLMVDNADWLSELELIPFLREIGSTFRVNEMIKAEGYRERLERASGLSFLEFSYQLLQAYDYLCLYQRRHCTLQVGGSDQWGNISAGVSLVRKKSGAEVHAFTIPLLTTADGKKMGKTAGGAVWLDPERTSPYDFYQYWINVADADVEKFLRIYTFLPLDEITELTQARGPALQQVKRRLADEVTAIVHGSEAAAQAREAAAAAFAGGEDRSGMPTVEISSSDLGDGLEAPDFLFQIKAVGSRSEARRLIEQGGAYLNDRRLELDDTITLGDFADGELSFRQGKKKYLRVVLKN